MNRRQLKVNAFLAVSILLQAIRDKQSSSMVNSLLSLSFLESQSILLVHQGIRSRKINKRNDLLMLDIVQDCSHS